mmetsp:Transcript_68202/g.188916  ORF Transcript_68202/g.188916 Transcript_68202/m.188916 type:complete len:201 (+) Transcript_68202:753-1355(+)
MGTAKFRMLVISTTPSLTKASKEFTMMSTLKHPRINAKSGEKVSHGWPCTSSMTSSAVNVPSPNERRTMSRIACFKSSGRFSKFRNLGNCPTLLEGTCTGCPTLPNSAHSSELLKTSKMLGGFSSSVALAFVKLELLGRKQLDFEYITVGYGFSSSSTGRMNKDSAARERSDMGRLCFFPLPKIIARYEYLPAPAPNMPA